MCHIQIEDEGQCISDGPGNYGNRENCRFSFTPVDGGGSVLDVRQHDSFKSGASFNDLNGATITEKSTFEFTTGSYVVKIGFKFCVSKPVSKGSICESTVAWADGPTIKPAGWVGAGPGADYWTCRYGAKVHEFRTTPGTYKINMRGSYGDGWNGGELTFTDKDTGAEYGKPSLKRGSSSGSATIVITKHPGTFDIDTHNISPWTDVALLMHGGC